MGGRMIVLYQAARRVTHPHGAAERQRRTLWHLSKGRDRGDKLRACVNVGRTVQLTIIARPYLKESGPISALKGDRDLVGKRYAVPGRESKDSREIHGEAVVGERRRWECQAIPAVERPRSAHPVA